MRPARILDSDLRETGARAGLAELGSSLLKPISPTKSEATTPMLIKVRSFSACCRPNVRTRPLRSSGPTRPLARSMIAKPQSNPRLGFKRFSRKKRRAMYTDDRPNPSHERGATFRSRELRTRTDGDQWSSSSSESPIEKGLPNDTSSFAVPTPLLHSSNAAPTGHATPQRPG